MRRFINPYNLFLGSWIPTWLLVRKEVSSSAKLVYARLCHFSGKNGLAYPKIKTLAEEVGLPKRNVDRALMELKKFELIDVERLGFTRPNRYLFLWHPWMLGDDAPPAALHDTPSMAHLDMPPVAHTNRFIRRDSEEENQGASASLFASKYLREDAEELPIKREVWR